MQPKELHDESNGCSANPESLPLYANRSRKGEACTQTGGSCYVLFIGAVDGAVFDKHEQIRRDRCK